MFSITQQAVKIVKENSPISEQLNCKVYQLKNGATVVDMEWKLPAVGWPANCSSRLRSAGWDM